MTQNRTGFADMGTMIGDLAPHVFVIEQLMNGMATATVVEVVNAGDKTVDVRPLVNQIDGSGKGFPHGVIHGIPWTALIGGNSAILVAPKKGDKGLAVFCHNDISTVKASGDQANPGSLRRYSWSDGIYVGGLPLINASPIQFIRVSDENGIEITSSVGVKINGDIELTGKLTATGDITTGANVTANGTSLHTHVHSGVQSGTANTGNPV